MIQLDQQDAYKFRVSKKERKINFKNEYTRDSLQNITLILTTFGLITTVCFHIFLKAKLLDQTISVKPNIEQPAKQPANVTSNRRISLSDITILLRVAMLYVASRLFITLATVYLPLYIEETKVDGKQALASVPLVSYVSSFTAALLLKYINRICGTKVIIFR